MPPAIAWNGIRVHHMLENSAQCIPSVQLLMLRQLAEELSEQLDVARKQQRHSDASQATTCPSDGGPSPEDFPEAQEEEPEEESDIHRPSIAKLSLPERMTPPQSPSNRSSELRGNPFDGLPVHQSTGSRSSSQEHGGTACQTDGEEHGSLAERADGACQTDGEGCTASEQWAWAPSHENAEDGEWVVIPEDANDEEHQLGEEGAACSSNFAAEVSLNPTTSDIELPRSVERKQLIFDDQSQQCPAGSTRSQDSSQDCGPGDDRVDAACQTDFEDCAVGGSLLETSATMCSHYPMALAGTEVGGGEVMHSDLHVSAELHGTSGLSTTECEVGDKLSMEASHNEDASEKQRRGDNRTAGGVEFAAEDLLLPDMLPYLSVNDLLNWRRLSQKTRSPKALLQHVAEMGSMERPAAVIAYSDITGVNEPDSDISVAAAFAGDFKSQKLYECRRWCVALARKRWTHFTESDVLSIVGKNLQNLLRHFQSADASLVAAARSVLFDYAFDGLYFVQQRIAVVMLDRLEDLVESSIISNLKEIVVMTTKLKRMLRSMSTAQRRKWASLLVKMLLDPSLREEPVIEELKMLWLVEDNPARTFAEAERQLRIFAKSASAAVRREMRDLIG